MIRKLALAGVALSLVWLAPSAAVAQERPRELPPVPLSERLKVPPEIPGADVPPIKLPPRDPDPEKNKEAIRKLYAPLPELPPDVPLAPGPGGRPWTLCDVERTALANSPVVKQAAADVIAARGAARQAGLYPNPTATFDWTDINGSQTVGKIGGMIQQTIITGGKLELARAAELVGVDNAELALRRAQFDVLTQVRQGYFAVLAAQETMRQHRALVRFNDNTYSLQVEQVQGGQAAPYEPLQLRALSVQARGNYLQSRNRYIAAWRQLAANLNQPGMPPVELLNVLELPAPALDHDAAEARMLAVHTDLETARNQERQAQIRLRLARVQAVPDVTIQAGPHYDATQTPRGATADVTVSLPIPLWNRNQGGVQQAQGQLARAAEEYARSRNELTGRLAEAYERYDTNRRLLDYYRTQVLPDQVRSYRGVYERHQQEPEKVGFGDIVNAQQNLAASVTNYLTALGAQWAAVADLGALLQADDLFGLGCPPVPPGHCIHK